jgi:hypothetical protein
MRPSRRRQDRCRVGKAGDSEPGRVIEEVLQEDPARVGVRWEDGHTSILTPAAGAASVTRAKTRAKA